MYDKLSVPRTCMTVVSLNKTSDNNNSFIKVLRIHTNVKFNLDILKLHLLEIYKLYGYYFFTPCPVS